MRRTRAGLIDCPYPTRSPPHLSIVGVLPLAREGEGMGGRVLALDVVLSAVFFFAGKWTPALKHNQSRDLLRFLLCRLYDESRGQLVHGQVTLAQGTLARKLGLSRQWVGELP